jgi:hypothetical protein
VVAVQVEVILNYNRTLLSRLEQRMQNWHSLGQCLGDIFLQVVRGPRVHGVPIWPKADSQPPFSFLLLLLLLLLFRRCF